MGAVLDLIFTDLVDTVIVYSIVTVTIDRVITVDIVLVYSTNLCMYSLCISVFMYEENFRCKFPLILK
jgi:hypothetical protein